MFSRPVQRKLIITSASREVGALSNPSVAMMQLYIRIGQDRDTADFSLYTVYSSSSCISGYWRRHSRFLSVYCILQFQLYIRVGQEIQQISLCILYTLVLAVYQGRLGDTGDFSLYTVYSSSSRISGQAKRYRFLSVYCIFQFQLYIRVGQEIQQISLCILYTLVLAVYQVLEEIQQISLCILYTLVLGVYQGRIGDIADFSLYNI